MSSPIVIDAHGLTRRFGEVVAVRDVSFQVQKASIFGLLGPNGSGKSTIIRMLLGILPPSAGTAKVLGYDVKQDAELIKRRVGYMSQQFSLYGDLTVCENIDFYGRIYGLSTPALRERRAELFELTSLGDYENQTAGTLSGGWKQRLALACALVHEPDLLFLDEPTAGIDPVARRQLWDLLFELSGRGVTLLVTTHYMDEAERCTDVGYIYLSRMLVRGDPEELKQLPQVTPEGATRYELRVASPSTALAAMRKIDGVLDATMFGEAIHILLDRSLSTGELLQRLGIDRSDAELRETTPTLEDVFVTLTKAAGAENWQQPNVEVEPAAPSDNPPLVKQDSASAQTSAELRTQRDLEPDSDSKLPPHVHQEVGEAAPFSYATRPARSTDGLLAIMSKEFAHIRRQPSTLFFAMVVPLIQTIIFGFALDTQIEDIPLAVYDLDGRTRGRELVDAMINTRRFVVVDRVHDQQSFRRALTSGRAKAGLLIPADYSDRIVKGEQAAVQLLIDGSDSQVATTALNTAQLLGLNLSIQIARAKGDAMQAAPARDARGVGAVPIEIRPRLLYNPDLESSHFFVPGLVGIILQLVTLFLTSFAVVRERELGTLEQLFVTPIGRAGLVLGKLAPYAILGFAETIVVLSAMVYLFGVPIHGSLALLLSLTLLFMFCSLGLGLLVSTLAKTQLEAVQFAFIIMLPSVLLSGFMFPRSQMPLPIYLATFAIPVTYFIEILRGVVLRAADFWDLLGPTLGLTVCTVIILGLSLGRFRKQLT